MKEARVFLLDAGFLFFLICYFPCKLPLHSMSHLVYVERLQAQRESST